MGSGWVLAVTVYKKGEVFEKRHRTAATVFDCQTQINDRLPVVIGGKVSVYGTGTAPPGSGKRRHFLRYCLPGKQSPFLPKLSTYFVPDIGVGVKANRIGFSPLLGQLRGHVNGRCLLWCCPVTSLPGAVFKTN